MDLPFFRLSVHQLVDFLLREGDIDNRIYNLSSMEEGTRLHEEYQRTRPGSYTAELPLKETFVREKGTIELSGKADGLDFDLSGTPVIEEIKSTVDDLDHFASVQAKWHFAQAECYALMYLHAHPEVQKAHIRLIYLSQTDSKKKANRSEHLSLKELEEKVGGYLDDYLDFFAGAAALKEERNKSLQRLTFPCPSYRLGQREMMKAVYRTARDGAYTLIEAPTGVGKTVSALYAALKSLSLGEYERLFYFTAKTTGAKAAEDTLDLLREEGAHLSHSSLIGKERMCLTPGASCNPDECPYAKDYYPKMRAAVKELYGKREDFSAKFVKEYGEEKGMCPFELSLDLSLYSDVVVADYNYLIDPLARLARYFVESDSSTTCFGLFDEAHNLVERGRECYGATLSLFPIKGAKKDLNKAGYRSSARALGKVEKAFEALGGEEEVNDKELVNAILAYEEKRRAEEKKKGREASLLSMEGEEEKETHLAPFPRTAKEVGRDLHRYAVIAEEYSEGLKLLLEGDKGHFHLTRLCPDPSVFLEESLGLLKGAALFSATLTPMDFYSAAIVGEKAKAISLPSPFDKSHMALYIAPLGLRYRQREESFDQVIEMLETFVSQKTGNYLIFFPSFEYLEKAEEALEINGKVLVHHRGMEEREKAAFLRAFKPSPKETTVGLSVLGGSFSEGVDLVSDRLIGVAVVGLGLPGVSKEREAIREHYEEKDGSGYYSAYLAPGLNKVFQAVGRLIRSEDDRGAVLLIDDRYRGRNLVLLQEHYGKAIYVHSMEELRALLGDFYQKVQ